MNPAEQQLQDLVSQSAKRHKQEQHLLSSDHMTRITALWTRMGQLYRSKWESQEGPLTTMQAGQAPQFTANAKLWARKTQDLNDEAFWRGFVELENRAKRAGHEGKSIWPPTYAEFIGYCEKPMCTQMYSAAPRERIPRYDEQGRVIGFVEKEPEAVKAISPASGSTAEGTLSELMGMFADEGRPARKLDKRPCLKCGNNFYAVLDSCESCKTKRSEMRGEA